MIYMDEYTRLKSIIDDFVDQVKEMVRKIKELWQRIRRMFVGYNAPSERQMRPSLSTRTKSVVKTYHFEPDKRNEIKRLQKRRH